jgi:anion-transporting  ArsA/GET3 family ATPase
VSGPPLLARRLLFVLGKGGVGKSTVAAALGLVGAREGKRALVVEVAGQEQLSALFASGGVGTDRESVLAPGLHGISIDVEKATEEYLAEQLHVRPVVELLARSRAFHAFAAAAPGLAELVTIGKIWTLATALEPGTRTPVWDLIVVDAPATGHGLALLDTAGHVKSLAGSGPLGDRAGRIEEVIQHPGATGVAVVARPEELAVSESIETVAALHERGLPVAAVVANAVTARRFAPEEEDVLLALAASPDPTVAGTAEAALGHLARQAEEEALLERLADAVDVPVLELPRLLRPRTPLEALEPIADALAASPEAARC